MNAGLAFALAALVCYGLGDVIYKRAAAAGLAAENFLAAQAWLFCPAILLYALATRTLHLGPAALWGAVAGLFIAIGFYLYIQSLRAGAVSIVSPIFRLNFIITAVLAILWLHESLTAPKAGGFLLALAAGSLLLGAAPAQRRPDPAAARRSLIEVLMATLAMGLANFCYKLGLIGGASPETLLAAQAVVFTGLLTLATWRRSGTLRLPKGCTAHSAPAAVVLVAAFLFLLHGLKQGDASVIVPVAQMGFVVAAVIGVLVFGEAWTSRKLAGLAAATAALLLLAIG